MAELTPHNPLTNLRYALVFACSYVALLAERVWNSFWPALTVLFFYGGIASLGLVRAFPPVAHAILLFVLTTAFALSALHLGDRFRWPRAREVRRAVEKQSGLRHRPLETALDKPIPGLSSAATELWENYQKRVLKLRGRTVPYRPQSTAAARDPWSLRHAALLLLVIGLVVAQGDAWTRIKGGLFVDVRQWVHAQPAALDAWITPPEYTNLNPVFLAVTQTGAEVEKGAISVPEGSILKVRMSGYTAPPKLTYGDGTPATFTEAATKSFTLEMPLTASGQLKIKQGWFRKLGEWPVTVTPDTPPEVSILDTTPGERSELKLHYKAKDDYGVTAVYGTITPGKAIRDTFGSQPAVFDLQPPSPDKEDHLESADLTSHPWAGSKVTLTLTAEDAALHSVDSAQKEFYLPERKFESAVARRLVYERKRLIWYNNPLTQRLVVRGLADIAIYPQNYRDDRIIYLGLNIAIKRLMYDGSPEAVGSVIGLLWDLAVRAEDGGLSFAKRELSEALQRLSEALKDKDLTKEELQKLQEEVAQKMRDYMSTLASEMQQRMKDGERMKPISPELAKKLMERIDMKKLMEQMRELTQGSERERLQKMADLLKKTVDNTDMNRMRQMQQQQQKAMEALENLQKLIERQQNLLDKTNHLKTENKPQPPQQDQQQQGSGKDQQNGSQQQTNNQQQNGQQGQQAQQQGGQQQQNAQGGQDKSPFPPMPQADGSNAQQQSGQQGQQSQNSNQQQAQQQQSGGQEQGQEQQSGGQQQGGQQQGGQQQGGQQSAGSQQGQQQGGAQGQGQQQGAMQGNGQQPMPGNENGSQQAQEGSSGPQQGQQQGQQDPREGQAGQRPGDTGSGGGGQQQSRQGGGGDKEGHGEGGKKAAESAPIRNSGEAAKEQASIRKQLGDVVRDISNSMPDVPENFSNADQSMKGSHGSLQQGDTRGSAPQQKQALDELQSAQDALLQQLADSMRDVMLTFGSGGGGGSNGEAPQGNCDHTDPFGRCTDGPTSTEDVGIPDEKERRRVQEIQEELRNRSNDYQRPKVERDYIDRLLDQFE